MKVTTAQWKQSSPRVMTLWRLCVTFNVSRQERNESSENDFLPVDIVAVIKLIAGCLLITQIKLSRGQAGNRCFRPRVCYQTDDTTVLRRCFDRSASLIRLSTREILIPLSRNLVALRWNGRKSRWRFIEGNYAVAWCVGWRLKITFWGYEIQEARTYEATSNFFNH